MSASVSVLLTALMFLVATVASAADISNPGQSSGSSSSGPTLGTARAVYIDATHVELGLGTIPLKVSGTWVTRPVTVAVSITNSGLSSSIVYYLYCADSSGSTACAFSATGHATDSAYGVETKSGDATQTLVAMVLTNGSSQFTDFLTLSYYSRREKSNITQFTAQRNRNGTTYGEIDSEIRNTFISWADELPRIYVGGMARVNQVNAGIWTSIGIDSTTTPENIAVFTGYVLTAYAPIAMSFAKSGLSETSHYATLLGHCDATCSNGEWFSGNTVGHNITIQVVVRG